MKTILTAVLLTALASPLAPAIRKNTLPVTAKEMKCMAVNVYHEARGEPFQGQVLVARTVINRANNYKSLCQVVYEKYQYSWTLKPTKVNDPAAYAKAYNAAASAFYYDSPVTHYHNQTVKPTWARKLKKLGTNGKHTFYH